MRSAKSTKTCQERLVAKFEIRSGYTRVERKNKIEDRTGFQQVCRTSFFHQNLAIASSDRLGHSTTEAILLLGASAVLLSGLLAFAGTGSTGQTGALGRVRQLVMLILDGGDFVDTRTGIEEDGNFPTDYGDLDTMPSKRRHDPSRDSTPSKSQPNATSTPQENNPGPNEAGHPSAPTPTPTATATATPTSTFPAMRLGEMFPAVSEAMAIPEIRNYDASATPTSLGLSTNNSPNIVFKNEEGDDSDRQMSQELMEKVNELAILVANEWPNVKLRVVEAWDNNAEHGSQGLPKNQRRSAHYDGRAVDITTSDIDAGKLGRLGALARQAGFDWVFYEDNAHIHASVK